MGKICVFTNFLEKSSKLTHHLAIDKLKTYPKIIEKQVCKKSKSAKKSAYSKKCNNKSAKIKKASLQKSLQKVCKNKKQVCKNSAKLKCSSLHIQKMNKSLHIQKMQQQVCKIKKASLQKSLHIQKWFRILFLISQAKNQLKSAYFNIIFPSLEISG